jgi:AcrR family transcriptional regulator
VGDVSTRTVDWTALRRPAAEESKAEGLRERKKRQMRQQLSDTATEMFVERGFDAVRVSEVAEACGVSEKTVFNYFPTKESLVLDRWDTTMEALRTGLAEPGISPVEAALRILDEELGGLMSWLAMQDDPVQAAAAIQRFGTLIRTTPALRAHQHDVTYQLVAAAAETIAQRAGMNSADPEPQIAANAIIGLWDIEFRGLRKYLDGTRTPAQVREAVTADVRRAAHVIESGLGSFGPLSTTEVSAPVARRHVAPGVGRP